MEMFPSGFVSPYPHFSVSSREDKMDFLNQKFSSDKSSRTVYVSKFSEAEPVQMITSGNLLFF